MTLCEDARRRVAEGYYRVRQEAGRPPVRSLRSSILGSVGSAVITEFKRASPSAGVLAGRVSPSELVRSMERGGACGVSVLTAREWFEGSVEDLVMARGACNLPLLMKDVIVSEEQIEAAYRLGAQAVLLILRAFKRGYTQVSLSRAIRLSRDCSLEVLLETCSREELSEALDIDVDLLGVNSRDLSTLHVDRKMHIEAVEGLEVDDKVLVAESGIESAEDIRRLKSIGYRAFLVGTSIMRATDVETKTRELVMA